LNLILQQWLEFDGIKMILNDKNVDNYFNDFPFNKACGISFGAKIQNWTNKTNKIGALKC
jgi:hypothetical protein